MIHVACLLTDLYAVSKKLGDKVTVMQAPHSMKLKPRLRILHTKLMHPTLSRYWYIDTYTYKAWNREGQFQISQLPRGTVRKVGMCYISWPSAGLNCPSPSSFL